MPEAIEVRISDSGDRFLAYGGSPGGRDQVHNTVRRWPGWRRLRAAGRVGDSACSIYSGPMSAVSADRMTNTSLEVTLPPEAVEVVKALQERERGIQLALAGSKAFKLRTAYETTRQPMPHQLTALAALHLMEHRAILADDMGLGKTSTALWALAYARRLLILCPQSVKLNWRDEIEVTLGAEWLKLIVPSGRKARADLFMEAENAANSYARVAIICNYDLLIHLTDLHKGFLSTFVESQGLICDESHYLKNEGSQRTRLVRTLFSPAENGAQWRLLLSGTPIRNTVEDIYSQIELVRPGTWTSKRDFDNRHLVIVPTTIGNRTFRQVQGAKDLIGLNKIVNTLQVRRMKEDVLDLPPKIHTSPLLTLEDDAAMRRVYKAMKDFAVLRLSELDPTTNIFSTQARTAVQAALRCEQIAQGFVGGIPDPVMAQLAPTLLKNAEKIDGRPNELMFPQHPKVRWLLENVKTLIDTRHRVVIYSRFLAPMFWLLTKLIVDVEHTCMLKGGMTAEAKAEEIQEFRDNARAIMICQVTIAEGFNLTECQDVIFWGRDWSPAINRQAEDRCHRIGTKGTVNIQIPIVQGTIETLIDRKLKAKEANAEQALATVTVAELKEAL